MVLFWNLSNPTVYRNIDDKLTEHCNINQPLTLQWSGLQKSAMERAFFPCIINVCLVMKKVISVDSYCVRPELACFNGEMRSQLGHIWDRDLASLCLSLSDTFCIQKPLTSKWALYKPNKVLYIFTDQNLFIWITIIPTNKSSKIISTLFRATGHAGHCPCEVHLSYKHFVAHI